MESRRTERDHDAVDDRRGATPPVEPHEWPARPVDRVDDQTEVGPLIGPRVRWGGVTSGFVVALGIMLLMTALGMAIGITAVGDPRAATDDTATGMGIGAAIWAALTLLLAYFLGGMVATRVTNRPDRGGAVIHGAMVWTLTSVFLLWLLAQGISLGVSSLFGALGGLARTATTVVTTTVTGEDSLTERLGFTEPSRILERLNDPETVSVFASATGMSTNEAQEALNQLRSQVETVRDNPDRVAAEVRGFLDQYADRVQQQAMQTAANVQEGATVGAWVTFGVLTLMLVVSILGALAGNPNLQSWRSRWARTGAV